MGLDVKSLARKDLFNNIHEEISVLKNTDMHLKAIIMNNYTYNELKMHCINNKIDFHNQFDLVPVFRSIDIRTEKGFIII